MELLGVALAAGGLLAFLLQVIVISLSGVMAPGPVTAATLAVGTRSRHGGALIAVGHGLVEFPLVVLIMVGMDRILALGPVQVGIGLVGGVVLIAMGAAMLRSLGKKSVSETRYVKQNAVYTGVLLSVGNPYFLLWWATVGIVLARNAKELGALAFVIFALVHWLCDLVWLELLSWSSFRGSRVFGEKLQRIVLVVCGTVLLIFGGKFIYDACRSLTG